MTMQKVQEFKGAQKCPKCYGTGEDQDSIWTLETARKDARAYNKHRLIREYGPDTKVMCGCPDVVSPLHFTETGKEKCYTCHGSGMTQEYQQYLFNVKTAQEQAARDNLAAGHRAKYAHLTPVAKDKNAATKNIKLELSRAFPGVKFSVRREHWTAININWENGPTVKEVEAITAKYQEGHFDGMQDLYEYDRDDPFTDIYGGAQYVFENRHYNAEDYTALIKAICEMCGATYKAEEWNIIIEGMRESATTLANRLLGLHSIPVGHKITGIEPTGITCGQWEEFYRPIFAKVA